MVEYPGRLDRNFYLRLHHVTGRTNATIFDSPDEGRPVGMERIVWSRDSSRLVLIGRHFFVGDAARLTNGEAIYLLYDIKSGSIRCNATQQSKYPNFTQDDLKNTDWIGEIKH